jgi:hypothetical protein
MSYQPIILMKNPYLIASVALALLLLISWGVWTMAHGHNLPPSITQSSTTNSPITSPSTTPSPKATQAVPPAKIICKSRDFQCVINAVNKGQSASMRRYDAVTLLDTWYQTQTLDMSFTSGDGGLYLETEKLLAIDGHYTDQQRQHFREQGKSDQEIDAMQAEYLAGLKEFVGNVRSGRFSTQNLIAYLQALKTGNTENDWTPDLVLRDDYKS